MIDLVILPVVFGLLGFITPCAIGMDAVFLGYISGQGRGARVGQALVFAVVRAVFLSLIGLLFAYLGQVIATFQIFYRKGLGLVFIILGISLILKRSIALPLPGLNPVGFLRKDKRSAAFLGVAFGIGIPACAAPLMLVLLAKTLFAGDPFGGMVSLFLFGFSMSIPLVLISLSERANDLLLYVGRASRFGPYIAGILLLFLGISSYFSLGGWIILKLKEVI